MKKVTLFALAILVINCITKAQIPNPDFENWIAGTGYEDPEGWGTPNAALQPLGAVVVEKTTDAHSGTYAAKLVSVNIIILTVPGLMGTGEIDPVNYNFLGGFPVTSSPATLTGWYKYQSSVNDTSLVVSVLTKWNTTTNAR